MSKETTKKRLSVIIPVYNEADTIARALDEIISVLPYAEIIVVDDGSTDGTGEVIDKVKGIKVIHLPRNRGKGFAMRCGIEKATGDYVIAHDADMEYSPEDIIRMIEEINGGQYV